MGYLYLLLTILAETTAVLLMKSSNGFQQKASSLLAVTAYMLSFVFLTLALKKLPVGTANAFWAGASTLLVAILGVFIFKESLNARQLIFLGLIVIGLVGLQWN
jgi:multidrug transporter EmrE-like cation transporter